METDAIRIAVVMQRIPLVNRWQSYQWRPIGITLGDLLPEKPPHCLRDDAADTRWLFTGFDVSLFSDEAEGYFLNIDSPLPCWFVMWRPEQVGGIELAVPRRITLSYNEAARLMDGGEQVDTLPASAAVIERVTAFVQEHYRPEPKKKRRKPSFEGGAGVEQMARMQGDAHGS